eukprot:GHVN01105366.1.p1 GENE.GHVN01105366.1~~GHVN01105366.1.p1  ORF type:complete len:213 (+),score=24.51 GHVN01105366.1:190-828(+)
MVKSYHSHINITSVILLISLHLTHGDETATQSSFTPLEWVPTNSSGDYDYSGTIEFCSSPTAFGYRIPNSDLPCGSLAPLIRTQAGRRYRLTLQNTANDGSYANLHTHGLHIPGTGNGDNPMRQASPGSCLHYNWTIPADHAAGTFWFHSHVHGHTHEQVEGGAVGLLIVDPLLPYTSPVNEWVNNERKVLILEKRNATLVNGKPSETVHLA